MTHEPAIIFSDDAKFSLKTSEGSDSPGTLEGYAMVWNTLSKDRGGYHVKLLPGSAKFETPTQALYHHNGSHIIGDTENGSLRITPDDRGVKVEIDLPNTQVGRDVAELVSKKYVRGMSFEMARNPKGSRLFEDGKRVFAASSFGVKEVTVTGRPAFPDTTIGMKGSLFSDDGDDVALSQLRLMQSKLNSYSLPGDVRPRRNISSINAGTAGKVL